MQVAIRLFAGLAEAFGESSVQFQAEAEKQDGPLTAAGLKMQLCAAYPVQAAQISVSMVAINREYAPDDAVIGEGDEIALIPPVSGG